VPGHLFLDHETEDLASFLQLSMLNGWGGYVLTDANYPNAFFTRDEVIDFYDAKNANLADARTAPLPSQPDANTTTANF